MIEPRLVAAQQWSSGGGCTARLQVATWHRPCTQKKPLVEVFPRQRVVLEHSSTLTVGLLGQFSIFICYCGTEKLRRKHWIGTRI